MLAGISKTVKLLLISQKLMLCLPCDFSNDAKVKEQLLYRLRNFFYVSDQRPDLVIQDLQNFFVEKSSYSRPVNVVF